MSQEPEEPKRGRGRPPTPRTCDHCLFIRYSDADLLSGVGGTCARSAESGRNFVKIGEIACGRWVRRSVDRRRTDERRKEDVLLAVNTVNVVASKRPRAARNK